MKAISIEEAMEFKKLLYIDVRSPSEYKESTIPNSINIPLFTNQEREQIGSLYYEDKESAYEEGFKIGTSKIFDIYKQIKSQALAQKNCKIIVFCWRGGMRSKSVVTNLNMMGINAYQLKGGYKAYRKLVLRELQLFKGSYDFFILHGHTGVGKTMILKELEKKEIPILDLEGLANNRGSMFGGMGLGVPAKQKMFDSLLYNKFRNNTTNYFFIESESRRIGNIILPDFLLNSMRNGKHILINNSMEGRIKNLKEDYLPLQNKEQIIQLIKDNKYFKKHKGEEWVETLIKLLYEKDYNNFIEILLKDYYDPLYNYSEKKYHYDFILDGKDVKLVTEQLIDIVNC